MKKSEMYKRAQMAVLREPHINTEETLEILRELMAAESLAKFSEEREEETDA